MMIPHFFMENAKGRISEVRTFWKYGCYGNLSKEKFLVCRIGCDWFVSGDEGDENVWKSTRERERTRGG